MNSNYNEEYTRRGLPDPPGGPQGFWEMVKTFPTLFPEYPSLKREAAPYNQTEKFGFGPLMNDGNMKKTCPVICIGLST